MISFFTSDLSYQLRSRLGLRSWLQSVAKTEGKTVEELNIILCSDEYLYKMNVQYLQHKTYTDIITFDQGTTQKVINGELYISLDRVRDNAKTLNISLKDELHRVMVHGLLHLCGYGDKNPAAKKKMTSKEDYYLGKRRF
ncbi:MAG: rRNA maturation RNase YbeY [Bacteroidia bacterium]